MNIKAKPACEGRCGAFGSCDGEVKRYRVKSADGRRTWSDSHYCDHAAAETRRFNYILEEVKKP